MFDIFVHTHTLCTIERKKVREREGGRERERRGKKNKYQLLLYHIPLYLAKETTETNAEKAVGTL